MHNLYRNMTIENCATAVTNSTGSTANCTGAIIDTLGYGGLAFDFYFGGFTTLAAPICHVEGGSASATTDMVDLEDSGASPSTADALMDAHILVDVGRPMYRWMRPVVVMSGAGCQVLGVFAHKYNPIQAAVSHSTADVSTDVVYLWEATTGASTGS